MSNLLLSLLIVAEVYVSRILGIITLVPIQLVVRCTMANLPSYNVSLLIATICNVLGKTLPSCFTFCEYVGTYCGMLYSRMFGVTAWVVPRNKPPKVTVVTHSFLCPCRTGGTNGRSPDIFSVWGVFWLHNSYRYGQMFFLFHPYSSHICNNLHLEYLTFFLVGSLQITPTSRNCLSKLHKCDTLLFP